jgi:hypothetical protein
MFEPWKMSTQPCMDMSKQECRKATAKTCANRSGIGLKDECKKETIHCLIKAERD